MNEARMEPSKDAGRSDLHEVVCPRCDSHEWTIVIRITDERIAYGDGKTRTIRLAGVRERTEHSLYCKRCSLFLLRPKEWEIEED